eukprot:g808.t1
MDENERDPIVEILVRPKEIGLDADRRDGADVAGGSSARTTYSPLSSSHYEEIVPKTMDSLGVRIFVRRESEASIASSMSLEKMPRDAISDSAIQVGDYVEILDTVRKWRVARVLQVDHKVGIVRIHYKGWASKWDETIEISSRRMCRQLGTHVPVTKDTGSRQRLKVGAVWDVNAKTIRKMHEPVNVYVKALREEIKEAAMVVAKDGREKKDGGASTTTTTTTTATHVRILEDDVEWQMDMQQRVDLCLTRRFRTITRPSSATTTKEKAPSGGDDGNARNGAPESSCGGGGDTSNSNDDGDERPTSSRSDAKELSGAVNAYFQKILSAFVLRLGIFRPLPPLLLQSFRRIFMADGESRHFFYTTYGKVSFGSRFSSFFGGRRKEDSGPFAAVSGGEYSRYFVSNVNYFGTLNGFDAILERVSKCLEEEKVFVKRKKKTDSGGDSNSERKKKDGDVDDESDDESKTTCANDASVASALDIVPMHELEVYFVVLRQVSQVMLSSFKRTFFESFQNVVCDRMLSLNHAAMRSLAQNRNSQELATFNRALDHLYQLLPEVLSGDKANEIVETFRLRLARVLLSSAFFTLQLRGADDLILQINMALRREKRKSFREKGGQDDDGGGSSSRTSSSIFGRWFGSGDSSSSSSSNRAGGRDTSSHSSSLPPKKSKWLKCRWLAKWINANKIVPLLLSSGTHLELLKRSRRILLFLARSAMLTSEHLELLCVQTTARGTHRAHRRELYAVLEDLATELPVEQVHALYDAIVSKLHWNPMSAESVTLEKIAFLHRFTENAMATEKRKRVSRSKRKPYALPLLWLCVVANTASASKDGRESSSHDDESETTSSKEDRDDTKTTQNVTTSSANDSVVQSSKTDDTDEVADDGDDREQVFDGAIAAIALILCSHVCPRRYMKEYMGYLVANVRDHRAVPRTLGLLKRLMLGGRRHRATSEVMDNPENVYLDAGPSDDEGEEGGDDDTRAYELERDPKKKELLRLVVEDTKLYCTKSARLARDIRHSRGGAAGGGLVDDDVDSNDDETVSADLFWNRPLVKTSTIPHSVEVKSRLEFLAFVIQETSLELSFESIGELFRAFCTPRGGGGNDDGGTSARYATNRRRMSEMFLQMLRSCLLSNASSSMAASSSTASWLGVGGGPDHHSAFGRAVPYRIFEKLLCGNHDVTLRRCGYDCFEDFFRYVNSDTHSSSKRTKGEEDSDHDNGDHDIAPLRCGASGGDAKFMKMNLVVDSLKNMRGISELWRVALSSPDKTVARDAVSFLIGLHVRLSDRVKSKEIVWKNFIDEVMRRLERTRDKHERGGGGGAVAAAAAAAATTSTSDDDASAEKLLLILSEFLRELSKPSKLRGGGVSVTEQASVRSSVSDTSLRSGFFRDRIAADCNLVGDGGSRVVIHRYSDNKRLSVEKYDGVDLQDIVRCDCSGRRGRAVDAKTFDVTILKEPNRDTRKHVSCFVMAARRTPKEQLFGETLLTQNEAYFDSLFHLLGSKSERVIDLAWNLLMTLPINPRMKKRIDTFDGHDVSAYADDAKDDHASVGDHEEEPPVAPLTKEAWRVLLNHESMLKLLYNLQIVEKIIESEKALPSHPLSKNADATRISYHRWAVKFEAFGGLAHLIRLLHEIQFVEYLSSSLGSRCVVLLLKVTSHFFRRTQKRERASQLRCASDDNADDECANEGNESKEGGTVCHDDKIETTAAVVRRVLKLLSTLGLVASNPLERETSSNRHNRRRSLSSSSPDITSPVALDSAPILLALSSGQSILHDDNISPAPESDGVVAAASMLLVDIFEERWTRLATASRKLLRLRRTIADVFRRFNDLDGVLYFALFKCGDASARNEFQNNLCKFCVLCDPDESSRDENAVSLRNVLVSSLLRLFESLRVDSLDGIVVGSIQLLDMLKTLVEDARSPVCESVGSLGNVAVRLATYIVRYSSSETYGHISDTMKNAARGAVAAASCKTRETDAIESSSSGCDEALCNLLSCLRVVLRHGRKMYAAESANALRLLLNGDGKSDSNASQKVPLLMSLFDECLFATPAIRSRLRGRTSSALPKCKSRTSRQLALSLLVELITSCPSNSVAITSMCMSHHELPGVLAPTPSPSAVTVSSASKLSAESKESATTVLKKPVVVNATTSSPDAEQRAYPKSATGFVGLRNLGNICYMNATNQQLFMIPSFREEIMESRQRNVSPDSDPDDSVLYQLQRMFGFLKFGELQFYNPTRFCRSLKDWDGNAVNVLVQDDACLYFTKLMQNLESCLEGQRKNPLKRHLSGVYGNEMFVRSKATKKMFYKTTPDVEQSFINVDVRGVRNLERALDSCFLNSVEYKWDAGMPTEEILQTSKRMFVKSLPSHFIVYLKRFIPDYTTVPFRYDKVNDKFEFPMVLNIHKYTERGRSLTAELRKAVAGQHEARGGAVDDPTTNDDDDDDDDDCLYDLCGVVMHRGVFDSGHYFSYIKTRHESGGAAGDAETTAPGSGGGTDDNTTCGERRVTALWHEFNDTIVRPFDPAKIPKKCYGGESGSSSASCTNAFMLVYDRRVRVRGTLSSPSLPIFPTKGQSDALPKAIADEIMTLNSTMWRQRNVLTTSYFNFIGHVVRNATLGSFSDISALDPSRGVAKKDATRTCRSLAVRLCCRVVFGGSLRELAAKEGVDLEDVAEQETFWDRSLCDLAKDAIGAREIISIFLRNPRSVRYYLWEIVASDHDRSVFVAQVLSSAMSTIAMMDSSSKSKGANTIGSGHCDGAVAVVRLHEMISPFGSGTTTSDDVGPEIGLVDALLQRVWLVCVEIFVRMSSTNVNSPTNHMLVPTLRLLSSALGDVDETRFKGKQNLRRAFLTYEPIHVLARFVTMMSAHGHVAWDMSEASSSSSVLALRLLKSLVRDENVESNLTIQESNVLVAPSFISSVVVAFKCRGEARKLARSIVDSVCATSPTRRREWIKYVVNSIRSRCSTYHDKVGSFVYVACAIAGSVAAAAMTKKEADAAKKEKPTEEDGAQEHILEELMHAIVSTQDFFHTTQQAIDHLLRAAKRSIFIHTFLTRSDKGAVGFQATKWMADWISKNSEEPPANSDDEEKKDTKTATSAATNDDAPRLKSKNTTTPSTPLLLFGEAMRAKKPYKNGCKRERRASLHEGRASFASIKSSILSRCIRRLRRSQDPPTYAKHLYDSDDDPSSVIGRRIKVKWTQKWYECKVQAWDAQRQKHYCVYNDGDVRFYKIGHGKCSRWRFVNDDDDDGDGGDNAEGMDSNEKPRAVVESA